MSVSYESVESALCKLFQDNLGIVFVPGNQNAPRPKTLYGTVVITDDTPWGPGSSSYKPTDGNEDTLDEIYAEQTALSVSVQTYRPGARTALGRVSRYLVSYNAIQKLTALGLGFVDRTAMTNLTQPVNDAKMEERAGMTVRLNVCSFESLVESTIGSVTVTGEAQTPEEIIPINFEVNES